MWDICIIDTHNKVMGKKLCRYWEVYCHLKYKLDCQEILSSLNKMI